MKGDMLKRLVVISLAGGLLILSFVFGENKKDKQGVVDYEAIKELKRFRTVDYDYGTFDKYAKSTIFDDEFQVNTIYQSYNYGVRSDSNIVLIINQKVYNPNTMDEFETYKNNVEEEGYSIKICLANNVVDPTPLRDYLRTEWEESNINGAFLVGQLPVAWYELPIYNDDEDTVGWDEFPCDLFFMDLDGDWLNDFRENRVYDGHDGNVEPEIWVGRLYTPTMTYHNANETDIVEKYFQKDKDYRAGVLRLKNQALSYVDKDWAGFHMEREVFKIYDEVKYINDGINGEVGLQDYKKRVRASTGNRYEWLYLAAHSSPIAHYFSDGLFYSELIDEIDVQVLFFLNFNCSAARFTDNDCLCNWYVMQTPYGLFSVGSTKSGSMLFQNDYYNQIKEGKSFGEAFLYWGRRHFEVRDWHYGMVCIGDPTLKISRFMKTPGPKFCYALCPERDEFINNVTPTFFWTQADSATKYVLYIWDESGAHVVYISDAIKDTFAVVPVGYLSAGNSYMWSVRAYNDDGKCVDFTQTRTFTVYRDSVGNLAQFVNPDFEEGSRGWTFGDLNPEAQMIDTTQAHHGKASLKHYSPNFYYAYTWQEINNVPNGVYTIHAWVKSSGDQYVSAIEIREAGEDVNMWLPAEYTPEWKRVSKIFRVMTGKVKVGIYSCAPGSSWVNVDDMSILFGMDTTVAPKLVSPKDGMIVTEDSVLLDWEDVCGVDNYIVKVFDDRGECVLTENGIQDSYFYLSKSGLQKGKTYKWAVQWRRENLVSRLSELRELAFMDIGDTNFYLSDLIPDYCHQDWGELGYDRTVDGNIISIGGRKYQRGLGTHANSVIKYRLEGKYRWFTADIGLDDEVGNNGDGVQFEVRVDGNTVFGPSPVFRGDEPAMSIKVDVSGGDVLELYVTDGGNGNIDYDHADWANAIIWKDKVGVEESDNNSQVVFGYLLDVKNCPNPFNSNTLISFEVKGNIQVTVEIFNLLGQKVRTLIKNKPCSGLVRLRWDGVDDRGGNLPSGIYFCRVKTERKEVIRKMLYVR